MGLRFLGVLTAGSAEVFLCSGWGLRNSTGDLLEGLGLTNFASQLGLGFRV